MTSFEIETYQRVVERGEAALARLSAANPMRRLLEYNVRFAKDKLERNQ